MSGEAHVECEALAKRYRGHTALADVSLTVARGECIAVIGHNGAGKSTLFKLLLGLARPSAGSVRVAGQSPTGRSALALRRQLGYLPESVAFAGGGTGRETLRFYARLKRQATAEVGRLLHLVGLEAAADRPVGTYSKGMRQRLGLAQAMLGSPALLVMDEPTSGLDPLSRAELYACVAGMRDNGTTTLIASHSLAEIERRIDRIALLRQGRLMAFGTLGELREQAGTPLRIRLSVREGSAVEVAQRLAAGASIQAVNGRHVDLRCGPDQKMALLRRVAGEGERIQDIEIAAPSLDEIYHRLNEAAAS